jgi:hypothetical protein
MNARAYSMNTSNAKAKSSAVRQFDSKALSYRQHQQRTEAILPKSEQISGQSHHVGEVSAA